LSVVNSDISQLFGHSLRKELDFLPTFCTLQGDENVHTLSSCDFDKSMPRQFKPEIIMEKSCRMLLDDEKAFWLVDGGLAYPEWRRCFSKIMLALIVSKTREPTIFLTWVESSRKSRRRI
jgi:hypothetical protein